MQKKHYICASFMIKKQLFISFLVVLLITAVSCNSNRKIYYSDGGVAKVTNDSTGKVHHRLGKKGNERKEKGLGLSFGKYSKLIKNGTLDQKYDAAIKYFDAEDYTKALGLFEELMAVYRGTARGEEVHYYYAYCNYNLEDYLVAGYQFRNYVKVFPSGKHAEECAYMNAYCFYLNSPEYSLDQIDTKLAIKEFQSFVTRYPKSERIPKCNESEAGA
jgi:TolA-binding protein